MAKSMTEPDPTLKDVWRLLGVMNKRFDSLERQIIDLKQDIGGSNGEIAGLRADLKTQIADVRAEMRTGFGALKASIEARDFRLDEHGRRITELELGRSPVET
jgi:hypothetical protein